MPDYLTISLWNVTNQPDFVINLKKKPVFDLCSSDFHIDFANKFCPVSFSQGQDEWFL